MKLVLGPGKVYFDFIGVSYLNFTKVKSKLELIILELLPFRVFFSHFDLAIPPGDSSFLTYSFSEELPYIRCHRELQHSW
jgi:hypothetical protein